MGRYFYWPLELGQEFCNVVGHPLLVGEVPLSLEDL